MSKISCITDLLALPGLTWSGFLLILAFHLEEYWPQRACANDGAEFGIGKVFQSHLTPLYVFSNCLFSLYFYSTVYHTVLFLSELTKFFCEPLVNRNSSSHNEYLRTQSIYDLKTLKLFNI